MYSPDCLQDSRSISPLTGFRGNDIWMLRRLARMLLAFALLALCLSAQATDFRNLGPEGGCIFDMTTGSMSTNPETLYCASITGGIYYFPMEQNWSTTSWTALHEEIPFQCVALLKDLTGNRVLLGGTIRKGIWRTNQSTLNDANFLEDSTTGLDRHTSLTSIAAYRLSSGGCDTVYAILDFYQYTHQGSGRGNGVYRSMTAGQTWLPVDQLTDPTWENLKWKRVYADAATRGTAYALCSRLQNYAGIWKTVNGGDSWSRMDAHSTDGAYPNLLGYFDTLPDVECLYQSPNRKDTLYFCATQGGGPSPAGGSDLDDPYQMWWGEIGGETQERNDRSVIGMIDLNANPDAWTPLDGFPPWLRFQGSIYVHDNDGAAGHDLDTVWVSVKYGGVWTGIGTIPTSLTWTQRVTDLYTWYPRSFIPDLGHLDGSGANYDTLFFGTWIAGVWSSADWSLHWQEMNKGMKNSDMRTFSVDVSAEPYKFYAGCWSHGIQRSTDYGGSWTFWGEETNDARKARFNRQFPCVIKNPFATTEQLLVGVLTDAQIVQQTSSTFLPGGLYQCTASGFVDATDGSIPRTLSPTCIDTVIEGTDAIFVGTGKMPVVGGHPIDNRLFRAAGTLTNPPYTFAEVRPPIPYNLAVLSVLADRNDASRGKAFVGLGDLLTINPGAIIYGPVANNWETIIPPHALPGGMLNTSFNHLRKYPTSNDTIFASAKGYDGPRWGALGQQQWGCLLQIYRDAGGNWHYWDISPPIEQAGADYTNNAVLGFDVRKKSTKIQIVAATYNNHNIAPNTGDFQPEVHICVAERNTASTATEPWNWFSDVIPELSSGQDFSPGVQDVRFAGTEATPRDSVYIVSTHGITRYDITNIAWPQ